MAKTTEFKDLFQISDEMKFDARLIDKRIAQNFLTRDQRDAFLKALAEEKDFDFTSMDEIEKVDA